MGKRTAFPSDRFSFRRAAGWRRAGAAAVTAFGAALIAIPPGHAGPLESASAANSADLARAATLPEGQLTVGYTLYWGGLKLGEATMEAALGDSGYEVTSVMKTGGLVEMINDSKYRIVAAGEVSGRSIVPRTYHSVFDGGKKGQVVKLAYDETWLPGPTFSDPPYGKKLEKYPVSEDQKRGSVDPLSGILYLIAGSTVTADKPCGTTVPVFDGRRRYNLNLSYKKRERQKIRGGKVYQGKALRCVMEYEQVAGFKNKKEEHDTEAGEIPLPTLHVWMADDLIEPFVVPVKVVAPTDYGAVTMILDAFELQPAEAGTVARAG